MRTLLLVVVAALVASVLAVPVGAVTAAGWVRVDYGDRITPARHAALVDAGAKAVRYAPRDAYVAWLDLGAVPAVAAQPGVTAVREVTAGEKVAPVLVGAAGPQWVEVLSYAGAAGAVETTVARLGAVAGSVAAGEGLRSVFATVDPSAIARLAALPGVRSIGPAPSAPVPEDEATAQVLANFVPSGGGPPVPGYEDFLAGLGLSGEGVTISIVDTGIDPNHPEFAGRIAARIDYGQLPTGEPVDSGGHGTHVAGIAAGDGAEIGPLGRVRDADGFLYGMGVAPGATLIDQNFLATTSAFPDYETLTSDAIAAGAVAWNASWAAGGAGVGYVGSAATMDRLVRDGDDETPGNQEFTLVFSAGNSGSDGLTAPKEAKNLITVAASMSHRVGPTNRIAGFSSRGPTADGRIGPTVTAPGEGVMSSRALPAAQSCSATGPGLEPLPADGLGLYAGCSGTSMAAPHVAGAVALIHEWWRAQFDGDDPSPAMSKAMLVNSARPLRASQEIPNNEAGWGMVNLAALFDAATERVYVDQTALLDGVGGQYSITVDAVDPTQPLRVTLVWTDPPSAGGPQDPTLVNDLDLTVEGADGSTYLGNVLDESLSVTGGAPDRLETVENVFLEQAGDGTYTITVNAANLPGLGVPAAGTGPNQDFALVITNATATTS